MVMVSGSEDCRGWPGETLMVKTQRKASVPSTTPSCSMNTAGFTVELIGGTPFTWVNPRVAFLAILKSSSRVAGQAGRTPPGDTHDWNTSLYASIPPHTHN